MTSFAGKTIAFVGGGMMGGAMVSGLVKGLNPEQVIVADPRADRGKELHALYGVRHTTDNAEALAVANIVVLAVKPQVFPAVAREIGQGAANAELVLSIMAGVTIDTVSGALGNPRIARAMPNTPGAIGAGISAWTTTEAVDEAGREMASALLGAIGEAVHVPEEKFLDMTTAISGSGPAYVFLFIEALVDAGVHLGFSRAQAEQLAIQTVLGAAQYAKESGDHVAALRNQVTSPGGTTAEALYQLEKGGLRDAVSRAVWSAYRRAVELGGGEARNPD